MQMRSCGPAGGAHGAHTLALLHPLAFAHVNAAEVTVHRHAAIAMGEVHHVAEAALPAGKLHGAVTHAAHGRARGRRVIHAQVTPPHLVDGVHAHGKARRHPRKLHGAGQKHTLAALARGVKVVAFAWSGFKPNGLVGATTAHKFGGQYPARALVPGHSHPVGRDGFVHQVEAIAFAKFAVKIDVTRKNLGHLSGHSIGDARFVSGCKQGSPDGAAGKT